LFADLLKLFMSTTPCRLSRSIALLLASQSFFMSFLLLLESILAHEAGPTLRALSSRIKNFRRSLCHCTISTLRTRILQFAADLLVFVNPVRIEEPSTIKASHAAIVQHLRLENRLPGWNLRLLATAGAWSTKRS
jgi:hypothetical protein